MQKGDCHAAEIAAGFVVDELLNCCARQLYSDYIDERVIPFTVEWVLGLLAGGLEMEFTRRDLVEKQWKQNEDPKPPALDTWMPYRIAVRKQSKPCSDVSSPSSRGSKASSYGFHPPPIVRPQPYPLEWAIERPDPELDRLRELKANEEHHRKLEAQKARIIQHEHEIEVKRLERMANELKKSQFTYDYDGKILLMKARPLPELPKVEFSIPKEPEVPITGTKPATPRPVLPARKTPATEVLFVKSLNAAPTMMDLLKLNPGVTAIESSRSKRGPESSQKTMTRDEYRHLIGEEIPSETKPHISKSPRLRHKLLAEIPDSDQEDNLDHYKSAPSLIRAEDWTDVDRFNMEIMKAEDWGKNATALSPVVLGPIPEKPSPQMTHAAIGARARKPRERPFIDRKLAREHLPPPRLGKTMGHGMVDPSYSRSHNI